MATNIEDQTSSSGQEEEINALRDHFKDNIRILSSIGQFSYILKIRADQYDVSLTLQLDKCYPKKTPEIIITAPRLTPDQISLVQQLLQTYSETLHNKPMILPIYTRLLKWFDENNIQPLTVSNNNHNTSIPRSPTNGKMNMSIATVNNNHNRISQVDEHENDQIKKSSIKTIDDILSRINLDNRLDKRYLRIGYFDQYVGLQEKPFNDFDIKSDLSIITDRQTNTLNIPKQRIQYLKYANELIWDKESRIDLICGSNNNQQTLYDLIKRHENILQPKASLDEKLLDIVSTNLPTKRYLTLSDSLYKPNYILSIPITDSTLISHYKTYREHFISLYPSLFSYSSTIDPDYLHLTLLTLRLESPIQVEQLIQVLKRSQEEIHYHCSYPERICLEFNGIDTFHSKTLFIKCAPNPRLEYLRQLIIERLYEYQEKQKLNEICFAGNYQEFIPHIILFKNKRKFSSIDHNQIEKIYFGKQIINQLQLSTININDNQQAKKNHCIFKLDLS